MQFVSKNGRFVVENKDSPHRGIPRLEEGL